MPYTKLSKISSRGEISRIILYTHVAFVKLSSKPLKIFDEIYTFTSGEAAKSIRKNKAFRKLQSSILY